MNVVELDQKRALIVKFAKGEPVSSILGNIESNTSETIQILRSFQEAQGRLPQHISTVESPLLPRIAEPAKPELPIIKPIFEVPPPVIIEKFSSTPTTDNSRGESLVNTIKVGKPRSFKKPDKERDKIITEKSAKSLSKRRKIKKERIGSQKGTPPIRKPAIPVEQKIPGKKKSPGEDLNESRKNQGYFKGIKASIINSFKQQNDDNEKRDSILAKAFTDQSDAKETGMLGILGPIAPAVQEVVGLVESSKDEDSFTGRIIGKFRKKRTAAGAKDNLENISKKKISDLGFSRDKNGKIRNKKGQFISQGAEKELDRQKKFSKLSGEGIVKPQAAIAKKETIQQKMLPILSGSGIPPLQQKTQQQKAVEDPEVLKKLNIVHDDLVITDKDQKKRDKKQLKAINDIESGEGSNIFKFLKNPLKTLKNIGPTAVAAAAVTAGAALITKDVYDIHKSYTEKDEQGENKGLKNIKAEDVGGVAGGVAGAIGGAKAGALIGAFVGPIGAIVGGFIGAGLGAIGGNLAGEWLGQQADEVSPDKKRKEREKAIDSVNEMFPGVITKRSHKKNETVPVHSPYNQEEEIKYKNKEALPRYNQSAIEVGKTMSVVENRSSKRVKMGETDKELQKKIDVSNDKLLAEMKETNRLLREQAKQKISGKAQPVIQDDYIPNGIDNASDLMAIKGLD